MKYSITLLLLFPIVSMAQKKEPAYAKLTGTLLFQKDKSMVFAGYGALGARFGRYSTVGFGAGYFKLKDAKKALIPIGLDFNFTDFKKKGILPVIVGGMYYPIYKERVSSIGIAHTVQGKFMYQIGGGFAVSSNERQKVLFTVTFSQIYFNYKQQVVTGSIKEGESVNLIMASLSFIL